MIKHTHKEPKLDTKYHPEDYDDDLPFDLAYDDMDEFVRSCGVILPEIEIMDIENSRRHSNYA